jgi:hypothetical protein
MAVLSVYIPESDTDRVLNAVASNHGWSSDSGQTIQSFVNQVIRNFLQEHVKAFEITEARVAAEAAAIAGSHVDLEDATTVTPYQYHMVCVDAVKAQYDGIAGQLLPGSVFNVNLANSIGDLYWGLSLAATEGMRESLAAMELLGGTESGGSILLYYVRCDFVSNIAVSSNIVGFDKIGELCTFGDVLVALGLTEIGGV